ncbi:MAG: alpha-ketoglutarate-dependent 2,4-dichlorophenoxyacetate dioxygenase [Gammaproteobacteria bacterium]|jgi:alpha-ketoglutarate-dependent 2,4-dichlorophenoxyacetate dioxygenase
MPDFEPLHPRFGARVTNVDLSQALNDELFAQLREAFARYSLLVFPDQPLTNAQQIDFSKRFGPLEATKVGSYGAGTPLVILSNVDEQGKIVPEDHRLNLVHKANSLWHSDSSFKQTPALASMLSAKTVPPSGGDTEYAGMIAALDDLPHQNRARIEGRVALHHFANSRDRINPELMTRQEHQALPQVKQVMVREIPETGKKALYVGSHAGGIVGMADEEARALIDELLEFATQPQYIYTHQWQENDAVLWDNRAVVHRGRPFARDTFPRIMIRTTIAGDGPTVCE